MSSEVIFCSPSIKDINIQSLHPMLPNNKYTITTAPPSALQPSPYPHYPFIPLRISHPLHPHIPHEPPTPPRKPTLQCPVKLKVPQLHHVFRSENMRLSTLFAFFFPSLSPPSTHCLRQSGDVVGVNMKGVRFMMGGGKGRKVELGFLWGEGGRALVGAGER